MVGICKIAHRHKNLEIGSVAALSFFGNICFHFSVLGLCSVAYLEIYHRRNRFVVFVVLARQAK
jgi:hypothetical protein